MMRESFADATFYFYGAGGELLYETTRSLPDFTEISSNYSYYVNGQMVAENGSGGRDELGFVGRSYDHDIGLYQLGARWYDPGLGRFVSPDPIPSDLNQYAYAGNNPFRYQDANGEIRYLNKFAEWSLPGFKSAIAGVDRFSGAFLDWGMDTDIPSWERPLYEFQGSVAATGISTLGYFIIGIPQSFARIGTLGDPTWDAIKSGEEIDAYKFADILREESWTLFAAGIWAYSGSRPSPKYGDLSVEELGQIQGVVNKAGRPLTVVGSAARGARTPISDIDYAVPRSSFEYYLRPGLHK